MTQSPRLTLSIKWGMYLLSLWLLLLLVIINKIDVEICLKCSWATAPELLALLERNYLPAAAVVLLLISLIFYALFIRLIQGSKEGPYELLEVEDKSSEHLVFLATYVIPLVGFGLETLRQCINLGLTLIVLGFIYVRTNLFYANPTLSLLGFRIYSAKLADGSATLITREDMSKGDAVNILHLDRRIYFAKKAGVAGK